jgi:hypothetical protein
MVGGGAAAQRQAMTGSVEELASLICVGKPFQARRWNEPTKDLPPVRAVSCDFTSSAGFLWAGDARPSR